MIIFCWENSKIFFPAALLEHLVTVDDSSGLKSARMV